MRRGQVLAVLKRSEIDAQVAQANAAYDKANRNLERVKKLEEAKVATREQLENVNTALEVARSRRNRHLQPALRDDRSPSSAGS